MPNTAMRPRHEPENGRDSSLRAPLALLLQATAFAHRVRRSRGHFGVDGPLLIAAGLTQERFQWLAEGKYVEIMEQTTRHSHVRAAAPHALLAQVHGKMGVVLTAKGEKVARGLCVTVAQQAALPPNRNRNGRAALTPTWDKENHCLWMGGFLVKIFKQPAPNQELILNTFQELGWPSFIDDPLSPRHGTNPKRRLHDTIECLKRHQITPLIRFHGDGTGRRAGWVQR